MSTNDYGQAVRYSPDLIRDAAGDTVVTEEEVKTYRYRPTVHADGRNEKGRFFMWACQCSDNPRVVLRNHGQDGSTYIVDGVPLKDNTPAGIAQALNTQTPKVLSVLDALSEVVKHEKE
jgi:hypothetical protein